MRAHVHDICYRVFLFTRPTPKYAFRGELEAKTERLVQTTCQPILERTFPTHFVWMFDSPLILDDQSSINPNPSLLYPNHYNTNKNKILIQSRRRIDWPVS